MSEVKRNHHLPRFYLNAWTDQKGRVALRRRGEREAWLNTVRKVGVVNGLYTLGAESLLGRTESAAAPIIRDLLGDTGVVNDLENREVLARFMAELHARQTYMSTFMGLSDEAFRSILEADADLAGTLAVLRGEFGPGITLDDAQYAQYKVRRFHEAQTKRHPDKTTDELRAEVSRNAADPDFYQSLRSFLVEGEDKTPHLERFSNFLLSRRWLLCLAGENEFITSDQPVFKHPTWVDRNGIGPHDTLCFVVSPTILLKMGDASGKCQWGEKEVHQLNLYIAEHCDHQIIATPTNEDYLSQIRLEKHRPWAFARSPQPPRVSRRVAC